MLPDRRKAWLGRGVDYLVGPRSSVRFVRRLLDSFDIAGSSSARHEALVSTHTADIWQALEEEAVSNPSPRKQLPNRTIHTARNVMEEDGCLVVSDFGQARRGMGQHRGLIMPLIYRPPEVFLRDKWSWQVDIWGAILVVRAAAVL